MTAHERSSFASRGFEEGDEVGALLRAGDAEVHVVVGDEGVGIGEPLVESLVVPGEVRRGERGGVREARDAGGPAAIDAGEVRAFPIVIEGMAAGAAAIEEGLAASGVTDGKCGRFEGRGSSFERGARGEGEYECECKYEEAGGECAHLGGSRFRVRGSRRVRRVRSVLPTHRATDIAR